MPDVLNSTEIGELLARTEAAGRAFLSGDSAPYLALTARTDDFTIMGPFGGATIKGFAAYAQALPIVASAFANGNSTLKLVETYASGDLLVLILEEEQVAEIGGAPSQPWSLRVTQVYRREADGWKVVHRHADPLVGRRTLQQAAALASA